MLWCMSLMHLLLHFLTFILMQFYMISVLNADCTSDELLLLLLGSALHPLSGRKGPGRRVFAVNANDGEEASRAKSPHLRQDGRTAPQDREGKNLTLKTAACVTFLSRLETRHTQREL